MSRWPAPAMLMQVRRGQGGDWPLAAQSSSCVGALSGFFHALGYSTSSRPQPADVYLLDDPLSAVDAHVGRHLFDRCICGLLGKVGWNKHRYQTVLSQRLCIGCCAYGLLGNCGLTRLLRRGLPCSAWGMVPPRPSHPSLPTLLRDVSARPSTHQCRPLASSSPTSCSTCPQQTMWWC